MIFSQRVPFGFVASCKGLKSSPFELTPTLPSILLNALHSSAPVSSATIDQVAWTSPAISCAPYSKDIEAKTKNTNESCHGEEIWQPGRNPSPSVIQPQNHGEVFRDQLLCYLFSILYQKKKKGRIDLRKKHGGGQRSANTGYLQINKSSYNRWGEGGRQGHGVKGLSWKH